MTPRADLEAAIDPRLLDLAALDRELIHRRGLAEFVRQAWHVLEPETPLRWGWALDAMCEHLTAVSRGEIRRLLINVPPGTMKSLLSNVFWPAWEWGPDAAPHLRIIGTSYSATYARRDSRRMRDLVSSEWYRARWPGVRLKTHAEWLFENDASGWRQATPFGSLTGGRAHRLNIDDPHSTEGAESEADRSRAVRVFHESAPNRLVDPETSSIVVIMQRLHEGDVSGYILSEGLPYEHLMLPMEFETDRRCSTSIGFVDPRTEDGELLFPERFSREVVDADVATLGSYAAAGQLQQRPAPRGGGIVKEAWFTHRFELRGAAPRRVVQSWDTASKPKEHNDPSVCSTFAEFDDHVELWHVDVGRHEFPDLVTRARNLASSTDVRGPVAPVAVLIEDKDSGQGLIQSLRKMTKLPVVAINPGPLDKATRLANETPFLEAGHLWLPADAEWLVGWLDELTTFPGSRHKDRADSLSQFLRWRRENDLGARAVGIVTSPKESNRGSGYSVGVGGGGGRGSGYTV